MFCQVSDLEGLLQIEVPATKVAAAVAAIADATAAIQSYCRQTLERVENDEIVLDVPPGARRLFLPELPVTELSAVVEDGEELVFDEDYILGANGVLYRMGRDWTPGVQIIRVTYSHGYGPLPAAIVTVCARVAARIYQAGLRAEALSGVPGVQSLSLGDYSVNYGTEGTGGVLGVTAAPLLLRSEQEVLNRYRL